MSTLSAADDKAASLHHFSPSGPYWMLVARTLLFALMQALIAGFFVVQGEPDPWQASVSWWPISATVTNFVCLALLVALLRREGKGLGDLYNYDRSRIGRDLLWGIIFILIAAPFAYLGLMGSTLLLYGGTMPEFFFPLPVWAAWVALLLFAPTVALAELPTYFGYSMPRIEALTGRTWLALLLAAFWLAAQHIALPLIFDLKFILWRFLAFVPLALVVGLIYLRTRRLFPLMITHGLIDLSLGWTVFSISGG
jgi:membrane protease YdiL (CAAX protease family)